jgi:malate dehydrogenase
MSTVAILGAGVIGSAIAHRLAERERVREIRLVDEQAGIAAGKSLDIQQSGPVGGFDTRLLATADALTAVGADVVVLADALDGGEWRGGRGLDIVERLVRAGTRAPLVFAGPAQTTLLEACANDLGLPIDRLVGSAASATVGAVQALVGAEIDGAGTDVSVAVAGRPPRLVIGWTAATVAGSSMSSALPAHRMLSIDDSLARLWPPGPQAIASATVRVVEALAGRSRRRYQAVVMLDGEFGARKVGAMLALELGHGRVLGRTEPTLSPQERTEVVNGLPT